MTSRQVLAGRPGVAGEALGRLHHVDQPSLYTVDDDVDPIAVFDAVAADLATLADELRTAGQSGPADIADASALIAQDPDLREAVAAAVHTGRSPDAAVEQVVAEHADLLARLPDPTLAARAADVRAVGRRVRARLRAARAPGGALSGEVERPAGPGPTIVVAYEVTADDLLRTGANLAGAVSYLGGGNAHTAIVARALGVPLVFGLDLRTVHDGAALLLDGAAGTVVVEPSEVERLAARTAARRTRDRREALAAQRTHPCRTRDGRPVTVLANVGSVAEADAAVAAGAPGVGLLRTEMPFLTAAGWPTVAAHVAALAPVLRRFPGAPVTVRTLDFAADKLPPFLRAGAGRALSLMLAAGEPFADQFRAILDAGAGVDLRIMIPMVAGVDELRACRALLAKAAAEAGTATPPLGAMVEMPEAVAAIDALAAEADFLSIGSNDLTATILGLDRRAPALTPARAAEPAVLRAIEAVVEAAARHGRPVSVCGDAAADPNVVPLLLRLGIGTLSVAPAALDEVRALVRDTDVTAPDRAR